MGNTLAPLHAAVSRGDLVVAANLLQNEPQEGEKRVGIHDKSGRLSNNYEAVEYVYDSWPVHGTGVHEQAKVARM